MCRKCEESRGLTDFKDLLVKKYPDPTAIPRIAPSEVGAAYEALGPADRENIFPFLARLFYLEFCMDNPLRWVEEMNRSSGFSGKVLAMPGQLPDFAGGVMAVSRKPEEGETPKGKKGRLTLEEINELSGATGVKVSGGMPGKGGNA